MNTGNEKRWLRQYSIFFQLIIFMILVALLPFLLINWLALSTSKNLVREHVHEFNTTRTETTAQWVQNYVQQIQSDLLAISDIQTSDDYSDDFRSSLTNISVLQGDYIDVVWVRTETSEIFNKSNRPLSEEFQAFVQHRQNYEAIWAGQIIFSRPFLYPSQAKSFLQNSSDDGTNEQEAQSNQNRETLMHCGIPLWKDSQPFGVIYAEINLTPLRRHIAQLPLVRPSSEIFIVDKYNRVIAHQNEELAMAMTDFSELEVISILSDARKILLRDKQLFIQSQMVTAPDGREMLTTIKLVDELNWGRDTGERSILGWGIVAQEPRELAFSPVQDMASKMHKFGVVAIILTIILASLLAFRLSRPILQLAHGVEQIAEGNYQIRVSIKAKNEIGLLATSFNKMAGQIQNYLEELKQKALEIRNLFFSSMETLVAAIDARDPYTRGHSLRVTSISMEIGNEMGLNEQDIERLRIAAMLHDVGKIGIRDDVLLKKGKLNEEEYAVMKSHPVLGATIMEPIQQMGNIIPGMKHHHEWWDGSGYPDGLKGKQIPLYARIIAIADTFDAMTSDRPYQERMDPDFVAGKVRAWGGTRYDPTIVEAFIRVYERKKKLHAEHDIFSTDIVMDSRVPNIPSQSPRER